MFDKLEKTRKAVTRKTKNADKLTRKNLSSMLTTGNETDTKKHRTRETLKAVREERRNLSKLAEQPVASTSGERHNYLL
jgi:hypothetical protein